MVCIQSSHTSPSKCRCSSPFGNLMSCSFLIPWLCSLNCFFCDNFICSIFCLYSLGCLSCGDVICGIVAACLTACTTSGITLTIIGIAYGSILHLIVFCALKFVLSCSLFILKHEAPPSSTLFFLLRALLGESIVTLFRFYSVIYISSLVLLTLVGGFFGLSF